MSDIANNIGANKTDVLNRIYFDYELLNALRVVCKLPAYLHGGSIYCDDAWSLVDGDGNVMPSLLNQLHNCVGGKWHLMVIPAGGDRYLIYRLAVMANRC